MMALLPNECFNDILACLDIQSLYKCLFVSRDYCKFTIPIIWRSPFDSFVSNHKISLINTLLTCLNEDEISSLIPCIIDNINNQHPLFEYGKFIRKINHNIFAKIIEVWLKYSTDEFDVDDCRVQKLVNIIYHMILRHGSNIQEFNLVIPQDNIHIDLPKFSVFTTYKPGITNLRTLCINLNFVDSNSTRYQNIIEFLNMVPKFCNSILNCYILILESTSEFFEPFLDIIKSQPLEVMLLRKKVNKDLLHTLECRTETLKKLSFEYIDFQDIDLSFIFNLKYLELLEFNHCYGFKSKNFENLPKRKLCLDKLSLWYKDGVGSSINITKSMIDFFGGKELSRLSLNIITPETIIIVKDACPNIGFLNIKILTEKFLNSTIPLICELSSLKTLHIQAKLRETDMLVKILCNYLTSVEYLSLNFHIDLSSFEYFTDNCIVDLKRWSILISTKYQWLRKSYLRFIEKYQEGHNSLNVVEIMTDYHIGWTKEKLKIVNSLKNLCVIVIESVS